MRTYTIAICAVLVLVFGRHDDAAAACAFKNGTPLNALTPDSGAWRAVTDAMAECSNFEAELNAQYRKKQATAFAKSPSDYHIGGVSTASLTPLVQQGSVRRLDELVAKYGAHLTPVQLIVVNDAIAAVAMMVDVQHWMYRKDILDRLGLAVPKTYAQVLKAAKIIERAGIIDYPLGGTYKAGWNLGQEFVNIYLSLGGTFFDKKNRPDINNNTGRRALRLMRDLSAYMDPEFLNADSGYVQRQFQQGRIAMGNLWASRAGALEDPAESKTVGKIFMSSAPVADPKRPRAAATLWWEGIVIPSNITKNQADDAFRVAMEGIDGDMMRKNSQAAIWLIDGYRPNRLTEGATATLAIGAHPYPSSEQIALLHLLVGKEIADYLTGEKSAGRVLADAEEKFKLRAVEKGWIK